MGKRTIHWFDLNWSKEKVNENVELKGKFMIFEGWPTETVANPDMNFLSIPVPCVANLDMNFLSIPVPCVAKSDINFLSIPIQSPAFTGKKLYILKARRPGDWHVHTMMNVKGGGPIIGPGKWVTITGRFGSFEGIEDRPGSCPEGKPCEDEQQKKKKK